MSIYCGQRGVVVGWFYRHITKELSGYFYDGVLYGWDLKAIIEQKVKQRTTFSSPMIHSTPIIRRVTEWKSNGWFSGEGIHSVSRQHTYGEYVLAIPMHGLWICEKCRAPYNYDWREVNANNGIVPNCPCGGKRYKVDEEKNEKRIWPFD